MIHPDYREVWEALKAKPTFRKEWVQKQVKDVEAKAQKELEAYLTQQGSVVLSSEVFSTIITKGVSIFAGALYDSLKGKDLSGFIEVILDGQDLTTVEMKDFIRAIPDSLISRIVSSSVGTVTGVHAWMVIEQKHRKGELLEDYKILRQGDGRTYLAVPQENDTVINIYLDDIFEGF